MCLQGADAVRISKQSELQLPGRLPFRGHLAAAAVGSPQRHSRLAGLLLLCVFSVVLCVLIVCLRVAASAVVFADRRAAVLRLHSLRHFAHHQVTPVCCVC